jgi:hypothetical protein
MDSMLLEADAVEIWPIGLASSAWLELPPSSPLRKYIKEL